MLYRLPSLILSLTDTKLYFILPSLLTYLFTYFCMWLSLTAADMTSIMRYKQCSTLPVPNAR